MHTLSVTDQGLDLNTLKESKSLRGWLLELRKRMVDITYEIARKTKLQGLMTMKT